MIIFTNVRKSIDYKGFITQNVHPALTDGHLHVCRFESKLSASVVSMPAPFGAWLEGFEYKKGVTKKSE